MIVESFLIEEVNETNIYLAACRATRAAALVDAGGFDPAIPQRAKELGLHVEFILVTHDHYDHTGGLSDYRRAFPQARILAGHSLGEGSEAVSDGQTFRLGTLEVKALTLPGHTPESTGFYVWRPEGVQAPGDGQALPPAGAVFSGDALFAGSVGGAHGAAHDLEIRGIREKIFTLPPGTPVHPGHGPATTVGIEREHNPFF